MASSITPPPTYRDIERIEDGLARLDGKVDRLGDQMGEMRMDTALLIAKFETDSVQRHKESMTASRRTKMVVTLVGTVISVLITLGTQLGWLTQKQAVALDHEAEAVQSSL